MCSGTAVGLDATRIPNCYSLKQMTICVFLIFTAKEYNTQQKEIDSTDKVQRKAKRIKTECNRDSETEREGR